MAHVLLVGLLTLDQEWNGVNSKSRYSEFEPVAHRPLDLGAGCEIYQIEIRLKFIKPVEVPCAGSAVVTPRPPLHTGKYHAFPVLLWPFSGPRVPTAESGSLV